MHDRGSWTLCKEVDVSSVDGSIRRHVVRCNQDTVSKYIMIHADGYDSDPKVFGTPLDSKRFKSTLSPRIKLHALIYEN